MSMQKLPRFCRAWGSFQIGKYETLDRDNKSIRLIPLREDERTVRVHVFVCVRAATSKVVAFLLG